MQSVSFGTKSKEGGRAHFEKHDLGVLLELQHRLGQGVVVEILVQLLRRTPVALALSIFRLEVVRVTLELCQPLRVRTRDVLPSRPQLRRREPVRVDDLPVELLELPNRGLRQLAESHLVEHVDHLLVLLSEDLGEVDRSRDRLLPELSLESKLAGVALADGRQLEEITADDDLRNRRKQVRQRLYLRREGREAAHLKPSERQRVLPQHLTDLAELVEQISVDHRDLRQDGLSVVHEGG
jgi:hypothetical protein